jgi:hypothetical protein
LTRERCRQLVGKSFRGDVNRTCGQCKKQFIGSRRSKRCRVCAGLECWCGSAKNVASNRCRGCQRTAINERALVARKLYEQGLSYQEVSERLRCGSPSRAMELARMAGVVSRPVGRYKRG